MQFAMHWVARTDTKSKRRSTTSSALDSELSGRCSSRRLTPLSSAMRSPRRWLIIIRCQNPNHVNNHNPSTQKTSHAISRSSTETRIRLAGSRARSKDKRTTTGNNSNQLITSRVRMQQKVRSPTSLKTPMRPSLHGTNASLRSLLLDSSMPPSSPACLSLLSRPCVPTLRELRIVLISSAQDSNLSAPKTTSSLHIARFLHLSMVQEVLASSPLTSNSAG